MSETVRPQKVAAGRVVKVMIEKGWRPPPMSERTFDRLLHDMRTVRREDILTPRQTEIVALLAEGHGYQGIADRLGISIDTVKTRLKQAYERLGATTAANAVAQALREGIIR